MMMVGVRRRRLGVSLAIATWMGAGAVMVIQAPGFAQSVSSEPGSGLKGSVEPCAGCHADRVEVFAETAMGRLFMHHPRNPAEARVCEVCHGDGRAHAESGGQVYDGLITFSAKDPTPVAKRNEICLGCHQQGMRLHWQGSAHESRDLACTSCHTLMQKLSEHNQFSRPTEIETCGQCHLQRRAQLMRSSHMPLREGKMTCSSCHNPHGSIANGLLKANTINDLCYGCHAEKRGPFLWEHPPVMEDCSNCHEPHGSNHEKMLKVAKPRLCQRCHVETRHPTRPQTPTGRFVFNRACTNCHSQVHGSNHPSGRAYVR